MTGLPQEYRQPYTPSFGGASSLRETTLPLGGAPLSTPRAVRCSDPAAGFWMLRQFNQYPATRSFVSRFRPVMETQVQAASARPCGAPGMCEPPRRRPTETARRSCYGRRAEILQYDQPVEIGHGQQYRPGLYPNWGRASTGVSVVLMRVMRWGNPSSPGHEIHCTRG